MNTSSERMYTKSMSFDPSSQENEGLDEKGLLQNHPISSVLTSFPMGVELQQQLNHEMGKFHSTLICNEQSENNFNMQEFEHEKTNNINWGEIGFNPYINQQQLSYPISSSLISNQSNFLTSTPSSLGLLGGFHHQRTELGSTSTNLFYDPQLNMPVNLCTPQQSSLIKDLFHHLSPAHGSSYGLGSSGTGTGTGSLFSYGHGVAHEEEVTGGLYHDGSFHEFSGDILMNNSSGITKRPEGRDIKHHTSEKQRRVHFSDKFQALRTLIPNPSKNDRATIIGDAIGYINELKKRVNDLKNQVDLKKETMIFKRQRIVVEEDGVAVKMEGDDHDEDHQSNWYKRKSSKNNSTTEVDVRVMEDEVTVKLVQQKKNMMNCLLLFVSKAHDELQLDIQHVAGGLIGDHYTYLFNSKICEGSTVYASVVANKVIEVLNKENATIN